MPKRTFVQSFLVLLVLIGLTAPPAQGQTYRVGSFTKISTTGTQNIAHGLGETPKAIILWTNGKTDENFSTGFLFSFGITDQSRTSYAVASASQHGVTTPNASRRLAAKAISIVQWGETLLAEADISAWDANTFTLNWTTNTAGTDYVVHFLAIGGPSVSSKVYNWAMGEAVGSRSVTGIGFQPSLVLHAHLGHDFTAGAGSNAVNGHFGLGVMDATGNQWATSSLSLDKAGVGNSDTQRGQQTDGCLYSFNEGLTVQKKAAYVSMDPDGFTVNFTNAASPAAGQVISLALGGLSGKAGSFLKSTTIAPHVQNVSQTDLNTSNASLTFPDSSASGNLLVVSFSIDNPLADVSSITDTHGNTYTRAAGPTDWQGGAYRGFTYYAANITGGAGPITVTITLTQQAGIIETYALEYTGIDRVDPLDQVSAGSGTGPNMDSGTKTTTQARELIYGFGMSSAASTVDPAFTARNTMNSNFVADRTVSAIGSYNVTGTVGPSDSYMVHMVTFKAPGAAQVIAGTGFQPGALLVAGVQNTVQANPQAQNYFGLGASDGLSEGSSAVLDRNNVATTNARGIDKTGKVFMKVNNYTPKIDAEAKLSSLDSDGFTLNWTTNDAVATQMLYLALGTGCSSGTYSYRKSITVNASQVSGGPQTNFPLLVSLTDADLKNAASGGRVQHSRGYDIIFRGQDDATCGGAGTSPCTLSHEVEKYDGTTGELIAWVRIPSINTGTVIQMYYGSGAINCPTEDKIGVWDSNYLGVYHLNYSPDGTIYDSTGNRLNLTSGGGMGVGDLISGRIGSAVRFDGTDDRLFSAATFITTSFTIEAWVSNNNTGYWGAGHSNGWESIGDIYSASNPGNVFRELSVYPDVTAGALTISDAATPYPQIADGQSGTAWRHVAGTYTSGSPGPLAAYIDGAATGYGPTKSWGSITAKVAIGAWAQDATNFNDFWWGKIDEFRLSKVARSSGWIATGYNNQNSPSTFYSLGSETAVAAYHYLAFAEFRDCRRTRIYFNRQRNQFLLRIGGKVERRQPHHHLCQLQSAYRHHPQYGYRFCRHCLGHGGESIPRRWHLRCLDVHH